MSHANKMRTVIQQVVVVFREEVAGECFFLLQVAWESAKTFRPARRRASATSSRVSRVPKDGNFSTCLGKHQGKRSSFWFPKPGRGQSGDLGDRCELRPRSRA